mgnify:CR=1 FL=1
MTHLIAIMFIALGLVSCVAGAWETIDSLNREMYDIIILAILPVMLGIGLIVYGAWMLANL